MSDLGSSSSGSDAEELARCREAAVPAWGLEQLPRGPEKKRTGRGLGSSGLAGGRGIFPWGLRGWMVRKESPGLDFFARETCRD